MVIPEEKKRAVRSFIERLFTMETETEVIEYICPALAGIVHADFYGSFLFPNVLQKKPLFCTNNNPEFIKAYNDTLSYYDIFTDRMINSGNSPAILHEMISPGDYTKNFFLNEADKFRGKQGRDGCYLPLIINNTLAGFFAFGRFMDYPFYYSREELQLLMFLISFVPAGLERALSGPPPGPGTAHVNGYGEIVDAGERITPLLKEVFGERYWNRPVQHEGENGKRFREMLERVMNGALSIGSGDVGVTVRDRSWKLCFRRLPLPDVSFREYFPKKSQVTVNVKTSGFEQDCLYLEPAFSRFSITPREKDIVRHLYRGCSNADIAAALGITEATVKRHFNNIFTKTGTDSRTRLVFRLLEG